MNITIPIIVDEDRVTTQSDLKPQDQSHDTVKIISALILAGVFALFVLWKKKYSYLILVFLPLGYVGYMYKPSEKLCVKAGAKIHLLPVYNGTIFETTSQETYFVQGGNVGDFTKVELANEQIGWVKNEDICAR